MQYTYCTTKYALRLYRVIEKYHKREHFSNHTYSIWAWEARRIRLSGQTGHTGLTAVSQCSQESLQQKRHLSRMYEPETKAWPSIQALWSTLPSPPSLSILNPPPTPSIPPPLSPPLPPPTPNWLWKMASVSHLGTEIKGKLQPTSMQNVIWKPPSYVLTIDFFLSLLPSPLPHSIPFSSFLRFIFIQAQYYSVKFEEKRPPNPLPDEEKKKKENEKGGGSRIWLSLVMPVCI